MKSYVVGEIQTHNELQRLIEEIKLDFKAINAELKQKLRSKTVRFCLLIRIKPFIYSFDSIESNWFFTEIDRWTFNISRWTFGKCLRFTSNIRNCWFTREEQRRSTNILRFTFRRRSNRINQNLFSQYDIVVFFFSFRFNVYELLNENIFKIFNILDKRIENKPRISINYLRN